MSQSLFYWIIYSYCIAPLIFLIALPGLNPYFIGLSTLIREKMHGVFLEDQLSQSLFYWIIYSYLVVTIT